MPTTLSTSISPSAKRGILFSAILLAIAIVLFMLEPRIVYQYGPHLPQTDTPVIKRIFVFRTMVLEAFIFFAAYAFAPAAKELHLSRLWSRKFSAIALVCTALFLALFIFYFGNQQFGSWDYSILIDTGWRQILGQRPYITFPTPNPPGFNLGIYWAFRVFGVSWNAQIFAIILFSVTTFLWMYWLLRRFPASRPVSLLIAFTVECVTVLPVCFWWYNDTTAVIAAVFLLAAVLCGIRSTSAVGPVEHHGDWLSYAVSLGLLCLFKPNIAGLLILPTVLLLFVAVRSWWRVLIATALGFALTFCVLLLNHVSIGAMIASYQGAAIERGGLSTFGLINYSKMQRIILLLWTLVLALPLVSVLPRIRKALQQHQWRELAFLFLLLPALPITLYGMASNGEWKDSETSILIVACGLIALVFRWTRPWIRIGFIAFLISMIGANLYFGMARQRVFGIMNHGFYEYFNADFPIRDGFFSDLASTQYFDEVQHEIARAARSLPGPIFLGPRLEFDYADLKIPSPAGWPVYYQPGTSFPRRDTARIAETWEAHHFQTLIFMSEDRVFYPDEFINEIDRNYEIKPGFDNIDVYVRRPTPLPVPIEEP